MDDVDQADGQHDETKNKSKNKTEKIESLLNMCAIFARRRAEVHFHQCFNPENLWGANSRDKRFMAEIGSIVTSLEAKADEMYLAQESVLEAALPEGLFQMFAHELRNELMKVFKSSHTFVFLYRTRSKASATLDKKYENYCSSIMHNHGIFVQLFNTRALMFNPTRHEIVPKHEPLDIWHDGEQVDRIIRVYNITNIAKETPGIAVGDPIAKFVGLRKGQLCKITRSNQSSGTYFMYRWCK